MVVGISKIRKGNKYIALSVYKIIDVISILLQLHDIFRYLSF
jgi:hypothetical protein